MELRQPIEEWPRPPYEGEPDTSELGGGRFGTIPSQGIHSDLYSIEQVRRLLASYRNTDVLSEQAMLGILQVQMLLHLYDRLGAVSDDLSSLASDSWEDHHNRPKGWMP